jgi:hypothetical protein
VPLVKPFSSVPQTLREWTQYFTSVEVIPDDDSTGADQIQDDSVTNPKLRNSAGTSVIGRASGTTGDPADIVASSNGEYLRRSGGVLGFGGIADADLPATIARDTEVTTAITNHKAESDPHPGYSTAAETAAAVSAHEAAPNPHPTYLTQAEGDGFYEPLGAVAAAIPDVADDFADDAAAAIGGIGVGELYHTSGAVKLRLA